MRFLRRICCLISVGVFVRRLSARNRRGQTDSFHLFRLADDRCAYSRPDSESNREFCMRGGAVQYSLAPHRRKSPLSSLWRVKKKWEPEREKGRKREGERERERAFVAFVNRIRRQVLVHISRGKLRTLFSGWRSYRERRCRMVRTFGSSNSDGFSLFDGVRCFGRAWHSFSLFRDKVRLDDSSSIIAGYMTISNAK